MVFVIYLIVGIGIIIYSSSEN